MRATFKPTNYTFIVNDNFFVQVIRSDEEQPFVAVFSDLCDAIDFARMKLERLNVRGVMVFSRDHQVFSEWKREEAMA